MKPIIRELDHYQRVVCVHLIPYFGDALPQDITPDQVQGFASKEFTEGKLTPKTINNSLVPLKTMFKPAVRWGYLRENPALYVERPRVDRKEMDFLTPEEIRVMLAHVRPQFRAFFLGAVLTAMRRAELLGLQPGDIAWTGRQIHVRRSPYFEVRRPGGDQRSRFVTPKSKSSLRAINMNPTLAIELKKYKLAYPPGYFDRVDSHTDGKPREPSNVARRELVPALRRAGLRRVSLHSLRHSFTALLIALGENIKYIQSQLEHTLVQTTLDRYGHIVPATHQEAAKRLDATLFRNSVSNWGSRGSYATQRKPGTY